MFVLYKAKAENHTYNSNSALQSGMKHTVTVIQITTYHGQKETTNDLVLEPFT